MRLILYFLIIFAFSCSTTHKKSDDLRSPADASCKDSSNQPPLFNVLENNGQQIVIELGPFSKVLNLSSDTYNFEVSFKGLHDERVSKSTVSDSIIATGQINGVNRITIPVSKTGVYLVTLFQITGKPFWKQKIFSIAPADKILKDNEKEQLAAMYAPIVSYHEQELYFPVSFEYLTNQVEKDSALDDEPFVITTKSFGQSLFGGLFKGPSPALNVKFQFKDILNVLPFYGHHESVLKSGLSSSANTLLKQRYGKNHATVYYSIFENLKWNEILINYHFFYSYDPKNSTAKKDALAAHIFDRESMTVVLRATTKQPLYVFYGAHLPNQIMAQLDAKGNPLQKWATGRTFVNWSDRFDSLNEVKKFETHPIPAVALGSHGIYPKSGQYAVMFGKIKALLEPAGGSKYLFPETVTNFKEPNSFSYKLKNLKLEATTSGCLPENILAYSGSTVDVLGPVNASFPPFTDREENFMSYADPNAPIFDMKK